MYEVAGDHDSMVLEPNVRMLAMRLRECLEAVDAAGAAGRSQPTRRESVTSVGMAEAVRG